MKVGDKVVIKTKEQIIEEYGSLYKVPFGLNAYMKSLFGKTVTIRTMEKMRYPNKKRMGYRITIEQETHWNWHDKMFMDKEDVTDKVHNVLRGLLS